MTCLVWTGKPASIETGEYQLAHDSDEEPQRENGWCLDLVIQYKTDSVI